MTIDSTTAPGDSTTAPGSAHDAVVVAEATFGEVS